MRTGSCPKSRPNKAGKQARKVIGAGTGTLFAHRFPRRLSSIQFAKKSWWSWRQGAPFLHSRSVIYYHRPLTCQSVYRSLIRDSRKQMINDVNFCVERIGRRIRLIRCINPPTSLVWITDTELVPLGDNQDDSIRSVLNKSFIMLNRVMADTIPDMMLDHFAVRSFCIFWIYLFPFSNQLVSSDCLPPISVLEPCLFSFEMQEKQIKSQRSPPSSSVNIWSISVHPTLSDPQIGVTTCHPVHSLFIRRVPPCHSASSHVSWRPSWRA